MGQINKKTVLIKSIKYIGKKFLHKKIIVENDVVILFSVFRNADSFQYIDELGYYYFKNNKDSITNTKNVPNNYNQIIYSIFCNIEFLFDKTENTFFSKNFCIFKLQQGYNRYIKCFEYSNNNTYKYVNYVLNKLLKSNYIYLN